MNIQPNQVRNLTPYPLVWGIGAGGWGTITSMAATIQPEGTIASVEILKVKPKYSEYDPTGTLELQFGEVFNLPAFKKDVFLFVFPLVKLALPKRQDLRSFGDLSDLKLRVIKSEKED